MIQKIILAFCAAVLVFAFGVAAMAEEDYAGYYAATGYDEDGSGKITDDIDGFPAALAGHVELRSDGFYEMLYFGGLTYGKWEMMKTEKGNDFAGLIFGETVDDRLADRYKKDELAFMLVKNKEGRYWLMQADSDEEFYMEKKPGKFDVDKVLDKIAEELAVEE
jgi:hypothetical protein